MGSVCSTAEEEVYEERIGGASPRPRNFGRERSTTRGTASSGNAADFDGNLMGITESIDRDAAWAESDDDGFGTDLSSGASFDNDTLDEREGDFSALQSASQSRMNSTSVEVNNPPVGRRPSSSPSINTSDASTKKAHQEGPEVTIPLPRISLEITAASEPPMEAEVERSISTAEGESCPSPMSDAGNPIIRIDVEPAEDELTSDTPLSTPPSQDLTGSNPVVVDPLSTLFAGPQRGQGFSRQSSSNALAGTSALNASGFVSLQKMIEDHDNISYSGGVLANPLMTASHR